MSFESATARDLEVLIHKESGFINYTKLCKDLSGGIRQAFKELVRKNPGFQKLVLSMEEAVGATAPTEITMEKLAEFKVLFCVKGGSNHEAEGTYGPRYMLDYLIFHFKPEYYKVIHDVLESIDELAKTKETTMLKELQKTIEDNKAYVEALEARNQGLETENVSLKEQIDFLVNKAIAADYKLDEIRNDTGALRVAANQVIDEINSIPIRNKKLGKVRDILVIYRTANRPANEDVRANKRPDQTWLGTYVGQASNYTASVPEDADDIYRSECNRLDTFEDLLTNDRIKNFVVKNYRRSILINNNDIPRFLVEIERHLSKEGNFRSATRLATVMAETEEEAKARQLVERKTEILAKFPNLHIKINSWKRRVYSVVENELIAPNPETKWVYRYGRNGAVKAEINAQMLADAVFVNENDARIRYE